MSAGPDGMLKMKDLAEACGVSAGTIKHYLREGLLGTGDDVVKTSRNMAYYPPEYVDRIRHIKRLQEERFMPLKLIARVLDDRGRVPRSEVIREYDVPDIVLDRLAEINVLHPTARGYDSDDVQIISAVSRFREGGFDETLWFTVYDTLRFKQALEPLVQEEIRTLLDRLTGDVSVERAAEIIAAGSEPMRDLIGAMHSKLLLAELRRLT